MNKLLKILPYIFIVMSLIIYPFLVSKGMELLGSGTEPAEGLVIAPYEAKQSFDKMYFGIFSIFVLLTSVNASRYIEKKKAWYVIINMLIAFGLFFVISVFTAIS